MSSPQAASEWTVGRVLSWATDDFRTKGFDSPRLDAELLLCRALKCDRVRLLIDSNRPLVGTELAQYKQLIQRRRKAEPIAYILGEREFFGLPIRVDSRVLIPRPDTEILVETALRRTAHRRLFGTAIDVCTGSGCVAIALAKERPTWQLWGSDISEAAMEVARDNALRLGAVRNLAFRRSNLLTDFTQPVDLITANPPYIASGEVETLQPDIRDFEPRLALDGGADGLQLVRQLVHQARALLTPGGLIALEIGCDQGSATAALLDQAGFEQVEITQDYGQLDRVVNGLQPTARKQR